MNVPTLLVLLLVAAALVLAIRVLRRSGGNSCGCGSDSSSACSGCSGASGCPYYKGK